MVSRGFIVTIAGAFFGLSVILSVLHVWARLRYTQQGDLPPSLLGKKISTVVLQVGSPYMAFMSMGMSMLAPAVLCPDGNRTCSNASGDENTDGPADYYDDDGSAAQLNLDRVIVIMLDVMALMMVVLWCIFALRRRPWSPGNRQ